MESIISHFFNIFFNKYTTMSLFFFFFLCFSLSQALLPPPRGFFLNCGSSSTTKFNEINYTPDNGFVSVGNTKTIKEKKLLPILSTLRYFPEKSLRKYCFNFPVAKNSKYLIRTTYYYGNFDGQNNPPVFDQIVGGTKWNVVNTSEDYSKGQSSYYEIIVGALGQRLSVCLAKNAKTISSPFISALDVQSLEDPMYNSTDFKSYAISLIARNSFGGDGDMISYPDDRYNRLWQPFSDPKQPTVNSRNNIVPSDFWNMPPPLAFVDGFTSSKGKPLELRWPPFSLPATKYYVALYFQDNRSPSPLSWRAFDAAINGVSFIKNLNVSTNGVMVYSGLWPLSGQTQITMTPAKDAPVGPVVNAGEIFQVVPLGGSTNTIDAIAMEDLLGGIKKAPADWSGDPCLPHANSWTGVTCSKDYITRVVSRIRQTFRG